MESNRKSVFGVPAKQLLCCVSPDFPREKEACVPKRLNHSPFLPTTPKELGQKQKDKREAAFAQRKAERASMRAQLREKYQLPKNWRDKKQMEGAKGKLPPDLLAIVKPAAGSDSGSVFAGWTALDFSSWRATAENAVQSLRAPVGQCRVM